MTLRAIANHVIFVFQDEFVRRSSDGASTDKKERHFVEKTSWGFKFANTKDSMNSARWGVVLAVGPLCDDEIQPGMRILIEPLKWTNGVQVGEDWFWRTDDVSILAVDDDFNIENPIAA
jgi:hypothetical protein